MGVQRLAVLDASHGHPATRRNFRRELEGSLAEFDVSAGELPETIAFDGIVVTGSRSSVYWDEPWIEATKAYVDRALEAEVPILGVCWGHQLLASVLGGTVEAMDEYEIGYKDIDRIAEDPLFAGIGGTFRAFTTHSDEVVALPEDAEVIAENETSIQGFRCGAARGVQFHPEYDMDTAREVTEAKDELSKERKAAVLEGITEENYRAATEAKAVFSNFDSIVAG